MESQYDYEDGAVAVPDFNTELGHVIHYKAGAESWGSDCTISGFESDKEVDEFLMWADFESKTFLKESPFSWKRRIQWAYRS